MPGSNVTMYFHRSVRNASSGQLPSAGLTAAGTTAAGAGEAQARVVWAEALEIFEELGDPRSEEMRSRLDG
mgnify:CR=1 FL=1